MTKIVAYFLACVASFSPLYLHSVESSTTSCEASVQNSSIDQELAKLKQAKQKELMFARIAESEADQLLTRSFSGYLRAIGRYELHRHQAKEIDKQINALEKQTN